MYKKYPKISYVVLGFVFGAISYFCAFAASDVSDEKFGISIWFSSVSFITILIAFGCIAYGLLQD